MKKTKKVVEHMKRYGSITPLYAVKHFNLLRLGSVIFFLRKRGMSISTEMIYKKDGTRYAKYILLK